MKLSFDWLSDYVDLSGISAQEVADKLTMGAFEVEEVRDVRPTIVGPVAVGEILEIYAHPDTSLTKVRVTKTRVGEGQEPLEIFCGADNIEVGQRIPVALPGSRVIDRKTGKPFPIEKRELKGVVSSGMLCSTSELGMKTADVDGILILSQPGEKPRHELGTNIIDLLGLHPDWVLLVEPRSNRGDALSVIGLAREVAALLKRPLKQPQWSLPKEEVADLDFTVNIENSEDSPFFSTRIIADVSSGITPVFIQRRLEAVEVRSISPIVDITNYVMHEYGQPLHAYDYARVEGHRLDVRRARAGERLLTLDDKERELTDEMLVIADAKGPVGVAGVMGGKHSEINDETKIVALEAAAFQPARVRRGSRLLGLSSDASLRFERGVDVANVVRASDRATYLILEHCGDGDRKPRLGKMSKAGHDVVKPVHVTCRMKELKRVLGAEFNPEQVRQLLTPLGFEVTKGEGAVQVAVPSYRQIDVTREIDIVEEVCRLWGYENLPESMPASTIAPETPVRILDDAKNALCGLGLNEAWLSSLTGADDEAFGLHDEKKAVRVLNPLSAEHQVLRQSLIPGLIRSASYNFDHGQQGIWLFEAGRVYENIGADTQVAHDRFKSGTGVHEQLRVAGFMMGLNSLGGWVDHSKQESASQLDFYHAKGMVENLLKKLRVDLSRVRYFRSDKVPACMHPSRTCQVAYDQSFPNKKQQQPSDNQLLLLGWIGEVHPATRESLRFRECAYVFEINLDIAESLSRKKEFRQIPNTPAVSRDLTVDVFEAVDHAAVHSCITSAAGRDLQWIELVSIFQPAEGQKSLSFRLNFQNRERTLTNEEVDSSLSKVRESLINRLSASFRT
jgi:phenylalanyl-tRNA synthetase beta chain